MNEWLCRAKNGQVHREWTQTQHNRNTLGKQFRHRYGIYEMKCYLLRVPLRTTAIPIEDALKEEVKVLWTRLTDIVFMVDDRVEGCVLAFEVAFSGLHVEHALLGLDEALEATVDHWAVGERPLLPWTHRTGKWDGDGVEEMSTSTLFYESKALMWIAFKIVPEFITKPAAVSFPLNKIPAAWYIRHDTYTIHKTPLTKCYFFTFYGYLEFIFECPKLIIVHVPWNHGIYLKMSMEIPSTFTLPTQECSGGLCWSYQIFPQCKCETYPLAPQLLKLLWRHLEKITLCPVSSVNWNTWNGKKWRENHDWTHSLHLSGLSRGKQW